MTYLQQLKVVHTVVYWDHHQLWKDILDGLLEAFGHRLETQETEERLVEDIRDRFEPTILRLRAYSTYHTHHLYSVEPAGVALKFSNLIVIHKKRRTCSIALSR